MFHGDPTNRLLALKVINAATMTNAKLSTLDDALALVAGVPALVVVLVAAALPVPAVVLPVVAPGFNVTAGMVGDVTLTFVTPVVPVATLIGTDVPVTVAKVTVTLVLHPSVASVM